MSLPSVLRTARRAALALLIGATLARAEPLAEALASGAESATAGQRAQAAAERVADDTRALAAEYRELRRQLDGLAVYNARLERQTAEQQRRLVAIEQASAEASGLARELVPLLARMIDSLERFIALDKPFALAQRRARIASLRQALERPDLSLAELFRDLLAAYDTELGYGHGISVATEAIEVAGTTRVVAVLRIGRLALFAQSEDGAASWRWNEAAGAWQALDEAAYTRAVSDGIAMARGQRPFALLRLPLPAAEAAP